MKDKIDAAFIQHAADILAETYTGLSGGQIAMAHRLGSSCMIRPSSCISIRMHTPFSPARPGAALPCAVPVPGRPYPSAAHSTDRWPTG